MAAMTKDRIRSTPGAAGYGRIKSRTSQILREMQLRRHAIVTGFPKRLPGAGQMID